MEEASVRSRPDPPNTLSNSRLARDLGPSAVFPPSAVLIDSYGFTCDVIPGMGIIKTLGLFCRLHLRHGDPGVVLTVESYGRLRIFENLKQV
jgi:hypothetical protein